MYDNLERDEIHIDGEDRRFYIDLDTVDTTQWMGLSVSTVTGIRDDPEKEAALQGWRELFDGTHGEEHTFPHHEEQKTYKQLRGTLGHWVILSQLAEVPKSDEETDAEYKLKNWKDERPSSVQEDVTRQRGVDPHAHRGEQAWSRCLQDINWATTEFQPVAELLDVREETVVDAETYLRHDDPNYSGQFDLLFKPDDGPLTLLDFKFASGVRYDNKLQLAAYKNAIEEDERYPDAIPRVMDVRLYPDDKEVEISANTISEEIENVFDSWNRTDPKVTFLYEEWDTPVSEYLDEFLSLISHAEDAWMTQVTFDEVRQRIEGETA